jgi:hypothetical protein
VTYRLRKPYKRSQMTRGWLSVVALLATFALVGAGCGGGDDGGTDEGPRSLLMQAASKRIDSGVIRMRAAADIPGFPILGDKLLVTAAGPFAMQASGTPAVDWDVVLRAGGQTFPAKLTSTDGKGYVDFQGLSYEISPEMFGGLPQVSGGRAPSLKSMGIDPGRWLKRQRVEEGEDIGGDSTQLVTGTVDERAVLEDVAKAADEPEVRDRIGQGEGPWKLPEIDAESLDRIAEAIDDAKVEVNVDEDGYARRVFASLSFTVPKDVEDAAFEGGAVSFELVLEEIGARVDVVPPTDPRPLSDLLNFAGVIFGVEKPSDLWTVPR